VKKQPLFNGLLMAKVVEKCQSDSLAALFPDSAKATKHNRPETKLTLTKARSPLGK
jgi:hypothetical protein